MKFIFCLLHGTIHGIFILRWFVKEFIGNKKFIDWFPMQTEWKFILIFSVLKLTSCSLRIEKTQCWHWHCKCFLCWSMEMIHKHIIVLVAGTRTQTHNWDSLARRLHKWNQPKFSFRFCHTFICFEWKKSMQLPLWTVTLFNIVCNRNLYG